MTAKPIEAALVSPIDPDCEFRRRGLRPTVTGPALEIRAPAMFANRQGGLPLLLDRDFTSEQAAPQDLQKVHPWYAVHVQSKFERIASSVLRDRGYEEFLPFYRAAHQWSDRVKQLDLPLFPGYLFCRINIADGLLRVVTAPGVRRIVSAGRYPISLSDREIELVRAVVRSGLPAMPWPILRAGRRILIEHGPLAGVEGIVLEVDKKCRLIVSVSLLQRSVAVEIQREWVRPVAQDRGVPCGVPLTYSLRNSPEPV